MAPEKLANLDGSPLDDLAGPSDDDLRQIEEEEDKFWASEDLRYADFDDEDYRDEED